MVLNACIISYGSIGDIDESQNMFRNLKSVDRVYQDYQLCALRVGFVSHHENVRDSVVRFIGCR
jgi:hypothetical protein